MRIFTKLGLRSISLFVKTRMDTILPKMKKKLQLGRQRKALGIPTKTCAKLFKKRVEVEFRKHRICWNIYPPIVPIVAMIGSKTPSSQLSSLRLSSCFSASHSMLVLASMSTGKRLAQLQVQVVFSAISSHQEEGTTRPPSLREMLIAQWISYLQSLWDRKFALKKVYCDVINRSVWQSQENPFHYFSSFRLSINIYAYLELLLTLKQSNTA